MRNKILIAHASKYGATTEIAEKIGEVLRQAGLQVDVLPAEEIYSLDPYQAVVLGSAVYAGQWRKEAVLLLESFEQTLSRLPVWFFSSGPTGEGDPMELMKGWDFPEAQEPLAERIHPRGIAFFHGALDMDKLNFGERLIVRGFRVPIGDFRDWDAITTWASAIAETLKQENWQPA